LDHSPSTRKKPRNAVLSAVIDTDVTDSDGPAITPEAANDEAVFMIVPPDNGMGKLIGAAGLGIVLGCVCAAMT
jgi:hypothetical protein